MIAGDPIEVLASWKNLLRPERVIPIAAGQPVPGWSFFGCVLNLFEHRGQRFYAVKIDVQLGAPSAAQVNMRIVEAGKDEGPGIPGIDVTQDGFRTGEACDFLCGSNRDDSSAADGHGLHDFGLVLCQSCTGVDGGVEEDRFRSLRCPRY